MRTLEKAIFKCTNLHKSLPKADQWELCKIQIKHESIEYSKLKSKQRTNIIVLKLCFWILFFHWLSQTRIINVYLQRMLVIVPNDITCIPSYGTMVFVRSLKQGLKYFMTIFRKSHAVVTGRDLQAAISFNYLWFCVSFIVFGDAFESFWGNYFFLVCCLRGIPK